MERSDLLAYAIYRALDYGNIKMILMITLKNESGGHSPSSIPPKTKRYPPVSAKPCSDLLEGEAPRINIFGPIQERCLDADIHTVEIQITKNRVDISIPALKQDDSTRLIKS